MSTPVRCMSCGKVLGNKFSKYFSLLDNNYSKFEALEALYIVKNCCRL